MNERYVKRARWMRASIERDVLRGKKTPDEAEQWLAEKNAVADIKLRLPPFASYPDLVRFDPMAEKDWTLAMAAAWIIWRTPEAVREHWNDYRFECKEWRRREENLADKQMGKWRFREGGMQRGWEIRKRKLVSLHDVVHEASESDPADLKISAREAVDDLWDRLEDGKPEATGIPSKLVSPDARRIVITRHEWVDLSWEHLHDGTPDSVANSGDSGSRYDEVRVPREQVCEIWKAATVTSAPLPQHAIDAEESVETQELVSPLPSDEKSGTTSTIETTKPIEGTEPELTDRETQSVRAYLPPIQAKVRERAKTLWPEGNYPARITDRDNSIIDVFKKSGETPPSAKTIQRALKEDNSGQ